MTTDLTQARTHAAGHRVGRGPEREVIARTIEGLADEVEEARESVSILNDVLLVLRNEQAYVSGSAVEMVRGLIAEVGRLRAQVAQAGWTLVPVEPTPVIDAMLEFARAHVQPKGTAPDWQPPETLESRGATVLVKNDRGQVCPMSRGVIHNNPGSANNDWDSDSTITGWMRLPAADAIPAPAPAPDLQGEAAWAAAKQLSNQSPQDFIRGVQWATQRSKA